MKKLLAGPALALALALALTACGGSSKHAASSNTGLDRGLSFAKCMRDHGADMPDPKTDQKNITLKVGGPNAKKALDACNRYLGAGTAAQQQQNQDQMLKYVQCMRGKGFKLPDPKPGQAMRIPDGANTQRFKQAMQDCNKAG